MREIVLDTETTGLDPRSGHRIIEIGCVEIVNRMRTGKTFHKYVNPKRDVPTEAFKVHGISTEFLQDKPLFEEVYEEFLEFIGTDKLVIHNAPFDMKFINYELQRIGQEAVPFDRAIDTLIIARKKFPGSPASLDALCKRFSVSLEDRDKHGALLDSELLYQVYFELCGGSQEALTLSYKRKSEELAEQKAIIRKIESRQLKPTEEEIKNHKEFLEKLKNPLWQNQ